MRPSSVLSFFAVSWLAGAAMAMPQASALVLDGDGDFIEVTNHPSLQPAGALTIECWARADSGNANRIVTKGDGIRGNSTRSYDLSIVAPNTARAWLFFQGGAATTLDAPLPDGDWHHIAVTFDGAVGEANLIIDGDRISTATTAENGTQSLTGKSIRGSSQPVLIGRQIGAPVWDFAGRIDRLRIWRTARSEEEIRCTINLEIDAANASTYPDLNASWNFNGDASDAVGSNNGALRGDAGFSSVAGAPLLPLVCGHSVGELFCFASTGGTACGDCPCGNGPSAAAVAGCVNSGGTGATLIASGLPSVAADTLALELGGGVPGAFAVLVSGAERLPVSGACPPGSGIVLAGVPLDGLRCVGVQATRHGTRALDASGSTTNAWGGSTMPSGGLIAGSGFVAGQTRHWQAFYREDPNAGCQTAQNTSNGVSILLQP